MDDQIKATSISLLDAPSTLIIGRRGRLARALRHLFPQVRAFGRSEIDLADDASVKRAVEKARPRIIVNCAAVTDLSLCERDPAGTRRVNVVGVANLAAASRAAGAMLVHISSDYASHPVNEYGQSKRDSEQFGDLTIRAKIYDGSHWAWTALRDGRRIEMTTCEHCNPISTTSLGGLVPILLQKGFRGLVSVGSRDRLSLFEIGQIWADVLGTSRDLVVPSGLILSRYRRPADTYLPLHALVEAGISVLSLEDDATSHRALFANYSGYE